MIYSQSMDLNHKKIHIVDSTMGLGITPTSRLHVFGNGTTSGLLNITNDKDATKDSSVVIDAIGNVGIGKTPNVDIKLDVDGFVNVDSSLTVDQDISLSGLLSKIIFNRGGNISAPGFNCKFTGMGIDIDTAQYFAIHYNRVLSSDNDTTISLGNFHLNLDNYTGKVGIGTTTPKDYLDINGNITFPNNKYIFWNAYNKEGTIYQRSMSGDGILMYQKTGTADKLFNIDVAVTSDAGNDIPIAGTKGVLSVNTGAEINIHEEIMYRDSLVDYKKGTTLSDNETYALPTNISWKGEIDVDSLGYTLFTAQIRCDANGTPYLEGVSWKRWSSKTYVEVGSTDGYLNITDGGSGMVITNRLGYTIKATLRFRTKQ